MTELIKTFISKTHNILQIKQENSSSIPTHPQNPACQKKTLDYRIYSNKRPTSN